MLLQSVPITYFREKKTELKLIVFCFKICEFSVQQINQLGPGVVDDGYQRRMTSD